MLCLSICRLYCPAVYTRIGCLDLSQHKYGLVDWNSAVSAIAVS